MYSASHEDNVLGSLEIKLIPLKNVRMEKNATPHSVAASAAVTL